MTIKGLAVVGVVVVCGIMRAAGDEGAAARTPKLLLNAQRLRRLRRDRERKTVRWVNFENRVNGAAPTDSEARGFDLALYYAITGDEAKGREAVSWVLGHRGDARVSAIVLDWCAPLISEEQKKMLLGQAADSRDPATGTMAALRDKWFWQLASAEEDGSPPPAAPDAHAEMANLIRDGYRKADELYAFCELAYALRANRHTDLRTEDPQFFSHLPELLLLAAKPETLAHPDWRMHVAALALVAIDPNLPASQFLQSWALEDNQTLREGPGVAYELLWADPYLPGVGYQNMDSWVYNDHGQLFARSSWEPDSCWVDISTNGVKEKNCPSDWQNQTAHFGRLTLIPMTERCLEIPHSEPNETILVWKLNPKAKVTHGKGKDQHVGEADEAGIWHPGAQVEGKACLSH